MYFILIKGRKGNKLIQRRGRKGVNSSQMGKIILTLCWYGRRRIILFLLTLSWLDVGGIFFTFTKKNLNGRHQYTEYSTLKLLMHHNKHKNANLGVFFTFLLGICQHSAPNLLQPQRSAPCPALAIALGPLACSSRSARPPNLPSRSALPPLCRPNLTQRRNTMYLI